MKHKVAVLLAALTVLSGALPAGCSGKSDDGATSGASSTGAGNAATPSATATANPGGPQAAAQMPTKSDTLPPPPGFKP